MTGGGYGPEIERGNAGPGFGYIHDPAILEAQQRASQVGFAQPDASVLPGNLVADSRLEYLGGELDIAISSGDHEGEVAIRRLISELTAASE